jgi:hypothetical protein
MVRAVNLENSFRAAPMLNHCRSTAVPEPVTSRPSPEPASNANRWQQALAGLQNQDLPDDRWADLLRRCASWYCIDELGRNPHTPLATEFDRFFADLLNEASISAGSRSDFLGRFLNITGEVS